MVLHMTTAKSSGLFNKVSRHLSHVTRERGGEGEREGEGEGEGERERKREREREIDRLLFV